MTMPECLQAPGLVLRRTVYEDARELFGIWSNEEVMRYQDIRRHTCITQTHDRLRLLDANWRQDNEYHFSVHLEDARPSPVGTLSCRPVPGSTNFAFGFSVGRPFWGQGIATAALMAAAAWLRSNHSSCELSATTHRQNSASSRALMKAGFLPCNSYIASIALPNLDSEVRREFDIYRLKQSNSFISVPEPVTEAPPAMRG